MSAQIYKIALFIDGANLYTTAKWLGFEIDFKRLLHKFREVIYCAHSTIRPRDARI